MWTWLLYIVHANMCTVHVNICTVHCIVYSEHWSWEEGSQCSASSQEWCLLPVALTKFNMLPWICFIYDLTALSWPLTPNLFELPFKQHVSNNMPPSLGQTPSNTENNDLQNSEVFVQKMQLCEGTKHTVMGQNTLWRHKTFPINLHKNMRGGCLASTYDK